MSFGICHRTSPLFVSSFVICFFIFLCGNARGQISISSSVLDGSGTTSTGGSLTNISASGQPGGTTVSEGGGYLNQAGFLNTFFLRPALDTDQDGVIDELDQDNDNDGLTDRTEIEGSSFSPASPTLVNAVDSDSDGAPDRFEAVAGTDPNNPDAQLELVAISNAPAGRGVVWLARGNNERTYVVKAIDDLEAQSGTVVFSNTLAGGSAPWYAITQSLTVAGTSNVQFYAVEVMP